MLALYENIKKIRKQLNLTQTELAEKLGYADKSMIAKIEKGQIDLPQSKIFAFAKALETSPSELMGLDGINDNTYKLSDVKEIKIIKAYRKATPTTQTAIDLLLGIKNE